MKTEEELKISQLLMKYEFAQKMIETEIDVLLQEFTYQHGYNPVEHSKVRMKSEKSIQEKLARKGYEYTASNILRHIDDVVGVRIVCSFLTDVYDLVSILSKSSNLIIKERKDYIAHPKKTGYSSYHLLVLVPIYLQDGVEYMDCEIQIRTIAMDFWASLDHKISYKFKEIIPKEVEEKLYEYSLMIQQLDEKMLELNDIVNKYKKENQKEIPS